MNHPISISNRNVHATEKRLNEMNRLSDMGYFPPLVNAGASANVVLTMVATWWVAVRHPQMAGVWLALVLVANLLPVVLLRVTLRPDTPYPRLKDMDFFQDQHKFSDWVYVAASANMAFWVLLTWTIALLHRTHASLAVMLVVAVLCTFSPVLLRRQSAH
jgi:hypothetical protein